MNRTRRKCGNTLCCLTLAVWMVSTAFSQTPSAVEAKATGVGVQYCAFAEDQAFAQVTITVEFTNRGRNDLVLLRELPSPTAIWVKNHLGQRVLTLDLGHQMFDTKDLINIDDHPDENIFEIIKPDQSVQRNVFVKLPVIRTSSSSAASGISKPGAYRVQTRIVTQPTFAGSAARIEQMLAGWRVRGEILVPQVDVTFDVDISIPPELRTCVSQATK